jgi:hypothetical protein
MALNSTDNVLQNAMSQMTSDDTSNSPSFVPLASNFMLPFLVASLIIVYCASRWAYSLCSAKLLSLPTTIGERRNIVISVVSDPNLKFSLHSPLQYLNTTRCPKSGAGLCGRRASTSQANGPDIDSAISTIEQHKPRQLGIQTRVAKL